MTRPRRREQGGRAERTVIHSSRKRKGLVGERRELVQAPEACVCGEGRVLLRVGLHVGAACPGRTGCVAPDFSFLFGLYMPIRITPQPWVQLFRGMVW